MISSCRYVDNVILDIKILQEDFDCCQFSFVPRDCNSLAHDVARWAALVGFSACWNWCVPSGLQFVIFDVVALGFGLSYNSLLLKTYMGCT